MAGWRGAANRMSGAHAVGVLTLAAVALALVALSAVVYPAKPIGLLSVSQMEKEQRLEHKMNMHVAETELSRWDALNKEIFSKPVTVAKPHPAFHFIHKIHPKHAVAGKPSTPKTQKLAAQPAAKKPSAKAVNPQPSLSDAASQHATAPAQPKAAVTQSKPAAFQQQQLSGHVKPAEQAGLGNDDEHVKHEESKAEAKEEAVEEEQNAAAEEHEEADKVEDEAEAEEGSVSTLGDDIFDMPVMSGEDEGDVHVPGDVLGQYVYGMKGQPAALQPTTKQQKLFLGEGPWTDVPTEGFGTGRGVGKNEDGAHGIAVDREAWSPEAQAAYMHRPPCHYTCEGGEDCEGHPGLTDGDCDEFLGRDMDIEGHTWPDTYPATYDAWSGNTHGLFKGPSPQQLRTAPVRPAGKPTLLPLGAANQGRPEGLAPLASARPGPRYPGLGVFAAQKVLASHLQRPHLMVTPQSGKAAARPATLKREVSAALKRFERRHPQRAAALKRKAKQSKGAAAKGQTTELLERPLGDERFFTEMDQRAPATQLRSALQWSNELEDSVQHRAPKTMLTHTVKVKGDGKLEPGEYRVHEKVHCIGGEKWGPCVDEMFDGLESKVVPKDTSDCQADEDCDTYNWQNFFKDRQAGQKLALVKPKAKKAATPPLSTAHAKLVHHPHAASHAAHATHAVKHQTKQALSAQQRQKLGLQGTEQTIDGIADKQVPLHHKAAAKAAPPHHRLHAVKPAPKAAAPPTQTHTEEAAPAIQAVPLPQPTAAALAAPGGARQGSHLLGLSDKQAAKDLDQYWDDLNAQDGLGPIPE